LEENVVRQPFKARTPEEMIALLSAVATAILAAIIIMVLYFGREIIIPIALAILLSFVLALSSVFSSACGCIREGWRS
jgi:predicted PurR-regulated permease PerM